MNSSLLKEVSVNELQQLRDEGLNNRQIAERIGSSTSTISRYLPTSCKKHVCLDDSCREEIVQLYKEGETAKTIAEAYGVGIATVYNIVKKGGVNKRKTKKEQKIPDQPNKIPEEVSKESSFGKLVCMQIGCYTGRHGEYMINFTKGTVELPDVKKMMTKEEIGEYIRDLMSVWREMEK